MTFRFADASLAISDLHRLEHIAALSPLRALSSLLGCAYSILTSWELSGEKPQ